MNDLRPSHVPLSTAGRLIGFEPVTGINRDRNRFPTLYPNSTSRRIAVRDIENHPRRGGKAVSLNELLRADRAGEPLRQMYRENNANRKAALVTT